ncbi:DsrE family protein [Belliella sp. R4-6]|uniref:DsrE family protein n=1 Tax=Belliella alkalica TaxID=1730871 RepID=A0ABS9VBN7_9BACT|nr:DsrE family protein [Belliella alkalica]MCH7413649.1 DsrE family protein [Belliella alkalica]
MLEEITIKTYQVTHKHQMKKSLLIIIFSVFLSNLSSAQVISEKQHKILFQLTNANESINEKFLKQLNNVLEAAPNSKIEVVTHGMGIDLLKEESNPLEAEIRALTEKGVEFVICENSLKQRNLKKSSFLNIAKYTPSAIIEIILKQEEGWTYIKAGP